MHRLWQEMNADTINNFTKKLKGKAAYDTDYIEALNALISVSCEVLEKGKVKYGKG